MTDLRRLLSEILRRPSSPPPPPLPPPPEDDDLLSEILLRLPPQPSSLPRANLVCKGWRRLVSDPGFLRRFRTHHRRNPPILGLFFIEDTSGLSFTPTLEPPNRVPLERFSLQFDDGDSCLILGCRHGLVLILNTTRFQVLVWDPVTGDQHRLAVPLRFGNWESTVIYNGAVLRSAGDVHGNSFLVVLVGTDNQYTRAFACVYSSETGMWGNLISTPLPSKESVTFLRITTVSSSIPSTLVGGSLYWLLVGNSPGILEFDLDRQSLAVIEVPVNISGDGTHRVLVIPAEGGGLGFLFLSHLGAQLWKRKTDCDGVASWVLGKTIQLDKLLSLSSEKERVPLVILGFADNDNVVFLWTAVGVFMVQLESMQFKKLFETMHITVYHPFASVYTAEPPRCPPFPSLLFPPEEEEEALLRYPLGARNASVALGAGVHTQSIVVVSSPLPELVNSGVSPFPAASTSIVTNSGRDAPFTVKLNAIVTISVVGEPPTNWSSPWHSGPNEFECDPQQQQVDYLQQEEVDP